MTTIHIGSDHRGFELKEKLKKFLQDKGYTVEDKGPFSYNQDDDYPDFVIPTAQAVANDPEGSRGIVIGRSGQGEAMACNRVKGARAAVYYERNLDIIKLSRTDDNANILSFAAGFLSFEEALEALEVWLNTPFSNEPRHIRRINKF